MSIQITQPSIEMVQQYAEYIQACAKAGIKHYQETIKDPHKGLQLLVDAAKGLNLPEGWAPYETYFAMAQGKILGAIRVRLGTNDFIESEIGHIGYETHPGERGRGVAKILLSYVLTNRLKQPVLMICDKDNVASIKVIRSVAPHAILLSQTGNPLRLIFFVEPVN